MKKFQSKCPVFGLQTRCYLYFTIPVLEMLIFDSGRDIDSWWLISDGYLGEPMDAPSNGNTTMTTIETILIKKKKQKQQCRNRKRSSKTLEIMRKVDKNEEYDEIGLIQCVLCKKQWQSFSNAAIDLSVVAHLVIVDIFICFLNPSPFLYFYVTSFSKSLLLEENVAGLSALPIVFENHQKLYFDFFFKFWDIFKVLRRTFLHLRCTQAITSIFVKKVNLWIPWS